MDKLCGEFLDDGGQCIWGCEIVYTLSEGDEDGGDAELMVGEVFEDVGVKRKNKEFVRAHDTGKELHEEDFVVEGKAFVVPGEVVVEFFRKGLWIVEELKGRKIWSESVGRLVLFLWTVNGVGKGGGCVLDVPFWRP